MAYIFGVVAFLSFPEGAIARKVNCDGEVSKVLGDLNKLRTKNEAVADLCQQNANEHINKDTAYGRLPGGDCEQTYGLINKIADRVEDKLEEACNEFNAGQACMVRNQQDCLGTTSDRFQAAGTKLREAVALLRKARDRLEGRTEQNEKDVNEYAGLGSFSPESVYGSPPPGLSPEAQRYYSLAGEQAKSMKHGVQFIEGSKKVEQTLNGHQAKLNAMAATAAQRAQNLGPGASTITGNLENNAGLLAQSAAGSGMFGGGAGSGSAPGGQGSSAAIPESKFLMKQNEGVLSDDEFDDALDGKPFPNSLAAKISSGSDASTEPKKALATAAKAGDAASAGDNAATLGGASRLDSGSAKLDAGDFKAGQTRAIASIPSSAGSVNGLELTGASAPGFKGNAKAGDKESEAFKNYADSNGPKKMLDRGGPSLRELLKQRMSEGGGGATRAMHEVLGGIEELNGEGGRQGQEHLEGDTLSSAEDIKGMDSEPLFVRIRAAHLRYQRVHVTDI